ncbi:MAG: DUF6431 domain-containing protein [Clostridia bacterium]
MRRVIRLKGGRKDTIWINRNQCDFCGTIRRELTGDVLPYKQYEAEIIKGVIEGFITADTLGFEDYPCEMTMLRWIDQFHRGCFDECLVLP